MLNGNVIVAYCDSNEAVYDLGAEKHFLTNRIPQRLGYAVSSDGGITFEDRGVMGGKNSITERSG